tara:strand:+ start:57 stop:167 length:111 start_codon:yes stop_codon:yes gene_type:complete
MRVKREVCLNSYAVPATVIKELKVVLIHRFFGKVYF